MNIILESPILRLELIKWSIYDEEALKPCAMLLQLLLSMKVARESVNRGGKVEAKAATERIDANSPGQKSSVSAEVRVSYI